MRDQLAHRGPDDRGLWLSADSRVCLGFRRLAIVDLSRDANQPFASADGRYVVVFNGEIYNFKSLRIELETAGVVFRTSSDTEVLVESFRKWGEDCLDRLSGMFAFAIWDTVDRRLFCARDRVGEKPFYYAQSGRDFLFASEVKAFVAWPTFRRRIHLPAIVDFLSLGFVADPKSIWEGCHKLPPGHRMWVDFSRAGVPVVREPRAYWDLQFDPDNSVRDWRQPVLGALESATREMSFADVPLGVFLSGGIDSSSVVAALSRGGYAVNSFTVGFDESDYDERPYAREVADLYGTRHSERTVVPDDVEAAMGTLIWHFDEPFNDYSYLPTYYVCKAARQAITVALSGDGGDELFAGYGKYKRFSLRDDLDPLLPPVVNETIRRAASALPAPRVVRRKLLQHTANAVDMFTDAFTLGFSHAALRTIARGELARCLADYSPSDVVRSLLRAAPPSEVGYVNAMRYLDMKLTLAGDILVKVDRASMAVALEVRPVFLHRDVLAVAARIPPGKLATWHETKRLLKAAVRPWLPARTIMRRKMGFAMPLKNWIGRLDGLLRPTQGGAADDWLDAERAARLIDRQIAGPGSHAALVHSLAFLRHWSSRWVESAPQIDASAECRPAAVASTRTC